MRMTVTIDDELLAHARELTGIENASQIMDLALRAFVQKRASQWLAEQGGTDPSASAGEAGDHRREVGRADCREPGEAALRLAAQGGTTPDFTVPGRPIPDPPPMP